MSERIEITLGQGWAKGLTLCFEDAATSAALDLKNFSHVEQVHGAELYEVSPGDENKTAALAKADAITKRCQSTFGRAPASKPLLIKTADCAPLVYVSAKAQSIALVHAGWRGLALGAHRLPFERGGFDPRETWVWLGPCINGRNFEVGEDVYGKFPREAADPKVFEPTGRDGKRYFHTWRYLEREFERLGVNVFWQAEVDTFENEAFASYRRAKREGRESAGRNYTWIR